MTQYDLNALRWLKIYLREYNHQQLGVEWLIV
jgi:hypothetical protein